MHGCDFSTSCGVCGVGWDGVLHNFDGCRLKMMIIKKVVKDLESEAPKQLFQHSQRTDHLVFLPSPQLTHLRL